MNMERAIVWLLGSFAALCLVLVTDCTCATPQWSLGTVVDKLYEPAWCEIQTDGKGNVTTIVHPENYYLICSADGRNGRVLVTSRTYHQWRVGLPCMVESRTGKLMKYTFLAIKECE